MRIRKVSIVIVKPERESGKNRGVEFRRIFIPLLLSVFFEDLE